MQRSPTMGRRIGREGQVMLLGAVPELVADDPGLHPGDALLRIDIEDAVEVLREIDDHGDIAALARETRPAAPAEDRHAALVTRVNGGEDVLNIVGDDNANRNLAVHRQIRGIQGPTPHIEPNFAANPSPKSLAEVLGLLQMGPRGPRTNGRGHSYTSRHRMVSGRCA
jgi:hypothetical protein